MGQLRFGSPPEIFEIEDRTLAHVKSVILAKLRRNESFALTLQYETSAGSGRESLWIHPTSQLSFRFYGSRPPALDKDWLDALILTANSVEGMQILSETGYNSTDTGSTEIVRLEEPPHLAHPGLG